uniref:Uncharacterized protein n=1 Tax=Cacopsylla melanoneura TaxID=428564 RepID=A0A8D8M705_9HEMI
MNYFDIICLFLFLIFKLPPFPLLKPRILVSCFSAFPRPPYLFTLSSTCLLYLYFFLSFSLASRLSFTFQVSRFSYPSLLLSSLPLVFLSSTRSHLPDCLPTVSSSMLSRVSIVYSTYSVFIHV